MRVKFLHNYRLPMKKSAPRPKAAPKKLEQERLAAALKANLLRRKQAAKKEA